MLKLKLQYFGHLMQRVDLLEKTLNAGRDRGQEEKGTTEDEMAGWHHQLDGHEFEWILRVGDGQVQPQWIQGIRSGDGVGEERLIYKERLGKNSVVGKLVEKRG